MIKSSNRLVGALENNTLYCSDDDNLQQESQGFDNEIEVDGKNELNVLTKSGPKKELGSLLGKLKKTTSTGDEIDSRIRQLGFKGNVSANELAARGVKLSIRDTLMKEF